MNIFRFLSHWQAKRKMAHLAEQQQIARDAFDAAVRRGDTRNQSETYKALKVATNQLIAAEMAVLRSRSKARRRARAVTPQIAGGFR